MFTLRDVDGRIVAVMSSNVDDLLFGSLPGHEEAIDKILNTFYVRERNETPFRFCGKEVVQFAMRDISLPSDFPLRSPAALPNSFGRSSQHSEMR